MKRNAFVLPALAALVFCPAVVFAQSQTEQEITQLIIDGYDYTKTHLQSSPEDYSQHGALEFWSSGGLLQEMSTSSSPEEYDTFNLQPKHIRVITLVEDQAAVAFFYSEGSMKPKGSSATSNYLVRVTAIYVKENGVWKNRSNHWSPVLGGGGTTATAPITP